VNDATSHTDGNVSPPDPAPTVRPKNKARWRRRLLWTLGVLVVGLLALRVALMFALPSVLRGAASAYGLNCEYERSQLGLLSGDAELWHVKLTPKDGASPEPIAATEYCRINLSPLMLLRGRLVVWRVEADGVDVTVERTADGRIPLLDRIASTSTTAPPPDKLSAPSSIDLTPPLRIDALRLTQVNARLRDHYVSPPVEADVLLDVRVSDVGSVKRPARFNVAVRSEELVEMLVLDGSGTASGRTLDARMDVRLRGLKPQAIEPYLAAFGVRPVAERIDATCAARVKADPVPDAPDALTASLELERIAATADGREAVGVDRVTLHATAVTPTRADLAGLVVDGVRVRAARAGDGSIRAGGMQFVGMPAAAPPPAVPSPAGPDTRAAAAAYSWTLAKVNVRDVTAAFDDDAVSPPARIVLRVEDVAANHVRADGASNVPVSVVGRFSAPGLARAVTLDGVISPSGATKTAELTVRAEGIVPDAARAYLDALGLESCLTDGSLACELTAALTPGDGGTLRGDAKLDRLSFSDGAEELIALSGGTVRGLTVDRRDNRVRIDAVELAGPDLRAVRRASGVVEALGFRTKEPSAVARARPSAPATAPGGAGNDAPHALPRFAIGKFVWKDVKLRFDDEAATPPAQVIVADAGLELTDLTVDLQSESGGSPGRLRAWLAAPGIAETMTVEGTVTPQPNALAGTLQINGSGLTASALTPYLNSIGIEPLLRDGALAATARFSLRRAAGDGLNASLELETVDYTDGGVKLAGLDALRVAGVELRPDELVVADLSIDGARAAASRDADGALVAGGFRVRAVPATQPSTARRGVAPHSTAAAPVVSLKRLRVNGASLDWTDRAAHDAFHTVARVDAELDGLTIGRDDAAPAALRVALAAADVVETLEVKGHVLANPSKQSAQVEVAADGIRGASLAPYLPAGTGVALERGRFRGAFDAMLATHAQGGHSGSLVVSALELHDAAGRNEPLVALESATVRVRRFDLTGKVVAIDEVSTAGVQADVRREADGAVRVGALRLEPSPGPARAEAGAQLAAVQAQPATAPAGAAPTTAPDAGALIAQAREPLPLVSVEKLDLNVKRLALTDEVRPGAAPLVISDLRVRNVGRIEAAGIEAEHRPPAVIETTMRVEPVADTVALRATLAPFAAEPMVKIDFSADGVRGDALTALAPELADRIDGSTMITGTARGQLEVHAKLDRNVWQDLDFSRPLEADVLLTGLEFRAAPDGPVLAGVSEIRADKVRLEPRTGAVHAKAMEITKPVALVRRDARGLHVLGCVVRLGADAMPDRATRPGGVPEGSLADATTAAPPAPPAPPAQAKPAAEIRVDKLLVSELDATFEDAAVEPSLVVPLTGLDVEVRGLSNMALYEDRPIRFNALLSSGKVQVRQRDGTLAERELFAQAAASGRVSLYPSPAGWVKSSVSGLELAGLAGPAKEAGVDVGGGVFDARADVRLRPGNLVEARTKSTFTDLKLSEAPDGPIKRTLQLPAPLDAVILALQDPSGAINVPLNVSLKEGNLSGGAIAGAAVGAFAPVAATAVASAPLKVVGGAGGLIGVGGGKKQRQPTEPVVLPFGAGDVTLDPSFDAVLERVVERMRRDRNMELTLRHELGTDDVAIVGRRANPDPPDSANLAYRVRQRRTELLAERAHVAGKAKGELVAGIDAGPASALSRLRTLDREIAETEDALDHVYDLLRPGAERQAARRTRAACIELGKARLEAAQATLITALRASDEESADARVRVVAAQASPGEAPTGRVTITMIPRKKGTSAD
jgi:hypothetical protein